MDELTDEQKADVVDRYCDGLPPRNDAEAAHMRDLEHLVEVDRRAAERHRQREDAIVAAVLRERDRRRRNRRVRIGAFAVALLATLAVYLAARPAPSSALALSAQIDRPPELRCGTVDSAPRNFAACLADSVTFTARNADAIRIYTPNRLAWSCSGPPQCVRIGDALAVRLDLEQFGSGRVHVVAMRGAWWLALRGRFDEDVTDVRIARGQVAVRVMRVGR